MCRLYRIGHAEKPGEQLATRNDLAAPCAAVDVEEFRSIRFAQRQAIERQLLGARQDPDRGLDAAHAPRTTANFMAYVDDGRFDDTSFYRAARRRADPKRGYVQGGIRTDARRSLVPVAHESTDMTGIRHLDATISMARGGPPGTAMGNFFITVGPTPQMDAAPSYAGYAAFGHVIQGMDVVRRILALPTGGGTGEMKGQMILKPVQLIRAERIDGVARPTRGPKPWLIKLPDFRKKRAH